MQDGTVNERYRVQLFNSLTRTKEPFEPISPPNVGMYVCGPTVYSDPHLGHARPAIVFDTVFRVLTALGYRVRYVRNITDVGHLENEVTDSGEDKIARKARLEQIEPMEVVQRYTLSYHDALRRLGCLPPSIEPRATGHMLEQIEVVKRILEAGLAYEVNGSVYFDLDRYAHATEAERGEGSAYGALSGKVYDDLMSNTRSTAGSDEKRNALDFALWKRAEPQHIMRWNSPWGEGFPGWHLECTTMSTRYLGEKFDIHGGGLDLQFPHHEAEIAQNHGAYKTDPAKYWMHNHMLTIDGRKMARSLGNFITLEQMFSGDHKLLDQAYEPMVVRYFTLQSHYRNTVDFSAPALASAAKGYKRLTDAMEHAGTLLTGDAEVVARDAFEVDVTGAHDGASEAIEAARAALVDDFHTPRAVAALFEVEKLFASGAIDALDPAPRDAVARAYVAITDHVLGLDSVTAAAVGDDAPLARVMEELLAARTTARSEKNFQLADTLRGVLEQAGVAVEDHKDGTSTWVLK